MINVLLRIFVCVVACLSFSSTLVAADEGITPVSLFSKDRYPLNANMWVLEDKTNKLTIDHVASKQYSDRFVLNDEEILNIGLSESTFWLKVSLLYPDAYPNVEETKQWYLDVGSTQLDIAELYVHESDGVYRVDSSDMRTLHKDRPLVSVDSVFPILLSLGQEDTFYLKLKKSTSLRVPLVLWTPEGFVNKVSIEEFVYGVFYGGMSILFFYNLFLYFSVRDESYLYYVLYLFGVTTFVILEMGHGIIQVEEVFGPINREYLVYIIWEMLITSVYFAKMFMSVKENYPRLNYMLNIFFCGAIVSIIVTLVAGHKIGTQWSALYNNAFMPTYIIVIFFVWMQGNQNAKYFFWAWIFNIIGFMIFSAVTYDILPATTLTLIATPIGILLEALLLAFALANRIKSEQISALAADERAVKSMKRYQSVFDNAREGIYTMALDGNIVSANSAMVKMFGFETVNDMMKYNSQMLGCLFEDLDKQGKDLMLNGLTSNNLCFKRQDGRTIWASHRAKYVQVKGKKKGHIEGVIENVTEENLKKIALKNQARSKAEKEIAEASTKAKGEFLANMNHEIRTPLAAVIGFSESLKDGGIPQQEKKDAIEHVVENSRTLLQLINDILDFSKIDAEKLDVEEIPFTLFDIVNEIESDFSEKAKERGLRFDVIYRYPIPSVIYGDPSRVSQVLVNLCSNAIKFTETGSILFIVSWDDEVNKLKFEVVDSGLGVNADTQEKLFQVFDQVDTSSTRQYGGAGLGLAISKRLSSMMGGDIEVLSEPGKGSVFTFTLEARFPPDMIWVRYEDMSKPKSIEKKREPISLQGTVLLAEDNVVNQKLLDKILKKTGVKVVIVDDGVKACEYCEQGKPDVILMDINMPNRNGLEATRYLRENGFENPIYALTAEDSSEEVKRAEGVGCNGFLGKPVNRNELYEILKKHIPHTNVPLKP